MTDGELTYLELRKRVEKSVKSPIIPSNFSSLIKLGMKRLSTKLISEEAVENVYNDLPDGSYVKVLAGAKLKKMKASRVPKYYGFSSEEYED